MCRSHNHQQAEIVRHLGIQTHVVNRLTDHPIGRNICRRAAHETAGTVFWVAKTILEQHPFLLWDRVKDVLSIRRLKAFDEVDRIVSFEFSDDLHKNCIVDIFADRVVEMDERFHF
ncbi:MAG: hypothetical protein VX930_03875 [Pseudomonadota bacterium]|nr:hypothetical protein [Pseudomonadota bacterium]